METKELVKHRLKNHLLISAGIFISSRKKIQELVNSLEDTGMTKAKAQDNAEDIFFSAYAYKQGFMRKLFARLERKH